MGQYNKAIITAAGESLIARAIVGEIQLSITKAKTSNYKYPGGTDLKALTDIQGIKQVMAFPETKVLSGDMIQTRTLFSNEDIQATYYIQNIGLYAMDGTQEVLFCIVTAVTPDEMPQYSGVAATAYIYNIQSVVQDAETIHITVNLSGTATIQDVLERVDATGGDISETVIDNLETIETKYPIPTAGEKVKTFLGKIITFMKNIKPLESDLTVYVATTGSDTTGDGSSAAPYKTITYALSKIPKTLSGYTASVVVAGGEYNEDLVISGFSGNLQLVLEGEITITSLTVDRSTVAFRSTNSVNYSFTTEWVHTLNLADLYCWSSVNANIIGSIVSGNNNVSILAEASSTCYIRGSIMLSGNTNIAIMATSKSTVILGAISGTGFDVAINESSGSMVACARNNIIATQQYLINSGSVMVNQFGAKIGTLPYDTTLYVSPTGSDENAVGTSENPFKTIQRAIDILPKDLGGHECTIQIADGTYDENVRVTDFNNGHLTIRRMGTYTTASILCNITSMICARSTAIINIVGLNFTRSNDHGFVGRACTGLLVQLCMSRIASTDYAGFYFSDMCRVRMANCRVTNRKWGVIATVLTDLVSENWETDSINTDNGIACIGGATTHIIGSQPSGAWNLYTATGGQFINENGTQISGLISSGLSCTWGTITGGYVRHGNMNGVAMVTINLQIQVTSALSGGQNYLVGGIPKPQGVSIVVNHNLLFICTCLIDANSTNIRFSPTANVSAGAAVVFTATYPTNS